MALLGDTGNMKGAVAVVITGCRCPAGAKDVTAAACTGEMSSRRGLAWSRDRQDFSPQYGSVLGFTVFQPAEEAKNQPSTASHPYGQN